MDDTRALPALLTVAEAADYCRCHEKTIRRWTKQGLRYIKPDPGQQGRVLIRRADLDSFLDDHTYGQDEPAR